MSDTTKTIFFIIPALVFAGALAMLGLFETGNRETRGELAAAFSIFSPRTEDTKELSQEELADIVKPAVVRIVTRYKGEAIIPEVNIDFRKFTISKNLTRQPRKIPIDQTVTGTGFVVNPEGYIMTNAHVVSNETIKQLAVSVASVVYIYQQANTASANDDRSEEESVKFGKQIFEYLLNESRFTIERKTVVLNPSSDKNKLNDLIEDGFPAAVVSVNDNFFKDDKDVALIKIDEHELPSLALGSSDGLAQGNRIHVFGFPSNADVDNNFLKATFTEGGITAIKDSQTKEFKIFQTDAKVSPGSSGGPAFNKKGEVVGIVTAETSRERTGGDNFALAIPIERAQKILEEEDVKNVRGEFAEQFEKGIMLFSAHHCKDAKIALNKAANANEEFRVRDRVDPYIDQCNDLIAAGKSIDSDWDALLDRLKSFTWMTWLFIGLALMVLIALLMAIIYLLRKVKREEQELNSLESNLAGKKMGSGGPMAQGSPASRIFPQMNPVGRPSAGEGSAAPRFRGMSIPRRMSPATDTAGQEESEKSNISSIPAFPEFQKIDTAEKPVESVKISRPISSSPLVLQKNSTPASQPVKPVETTPARPTAQASSAAPAGVLPQAQAAPAQPSQPSAPIQPHPAVNPALQKYVRDARKAGLDDMTIKAELKRVGWTDGDIFNALTYS